MPLYYKLGMNKDDSKYNTDQCFTVQITLLSDVKLTFRQYIHNTQGHHYTSSCNWYHLYTRQTLYRPQISSLNVIPKFSARSCIFEDRAMSRKIDSGDSLKEVEKDLMLWGEIEESEKLVVTGSSTQGPWLELPMFWQTSREKTTQVVLCTQK